MKKKNVGVLCFLFIFYIAIVSGYFLSTLGNIGLFTSNNTTINEDLYNSFKAADNSKKTTPMWNWTQSVSEMSEDNVKEIVSNSYSQSGYDGMVIKPNWIDGYFTDTFFSLYRAALEEGTTNNMKFMIHDENGYPSYTANGSFGESLPDLTSKRLDMIEKDGNSGESVSFTTPTGSLMGVVAMNSDTFERQDITDSATRSSDGTFEIKYDVPDGNWKVMAFICVKDESNGVDYLNKEAVDSYIDIVYERYYKELETYFDNGTITGFYYDQPTFWYQDGKTPFGVKDGRMWTDMYNSYFQTEYNESPVTYYPALFYDIGEATTESRIKLLNLRSSLFSSNYIGELTKWAENRNTSVTGHLLKEDAVNPVGLSGDLMKDFENQTYPAIKVTEANETTSAFKLVSSAAYNWDKTLAIAETFNGLGNSSSMDDLMKATLPLYSSGINSVIPNSIGSTTDSVETAESPDISFQNDNLDMSVFNTYVSRLNTVLQGGRHIADIAVLYPIQDLEGQFFFNNELNNVDYSNYFTIGDTLTTKIHQDFTYIHPDSLNSNVTIKDGIMKLNNETNYESFHTLIIPGMKAISLENLKQIQNFYNSGGTIIMAGEMPTQGTLTNETDEIKEIMAALFNTSDNEEITVNQNKNKGQAYYLRDYSDNALSTALEQNNKTYGINIKSSQTDEPGNVQYIQKENSETNFLFLSNTMNVKTEITVTISGNHEVIEIWNPEDGSKETIEPSLLTDEKGDYTTFKVPMDKISSLFVAFT